MSACGAKVKGCRCPARGLSQFRRTASGLLDELRHEGIVDAFIHIDAFHREAHHAVGMHGAAQHGGGGAFEVGAGGDDDRILAAQFEVAGNQPLGAVHGDLAAGGHAAGEAQHIGIVDHGLAGFGIAGDEIEHRGQLGHGAHALEQRAGESRRDLAGLQQHGAAGEQRGHGIEQRQHHGRVPRRDHAAQRVGHELRAHLDAGHGLRWAAVAGLLERAGGILEPAADVAHRDEALQIRGVAAAGILGIGLGNGGGALFHFAQPARHHAAAARKTHARPRPSGFRAAARPSRPPRRGSQPANRNQSARCADCGPEWCAGLASAMVSPRWLSSLLRHGHYALRKFRGPYAGTIHPGAEFLRNAEALPIRSRCVRLRSAGRAACRAGRLVLPLRRRRCLSHAARRHHPQWRRHGLGVPSFRRQGGFPLSLCEDRALPGRAQGAAGAWRASIAMASPTRRSWRSSTATTPAIPAPSGITAGSMRCARIPCRWNWIRTRWKRAATAEFKPQLQDEDHDGASEDRSGHGRMVELRPVLPQGIPQRDGADGARPAGQPGAPGRAGDAVSGRVPRLRR